MTNELNQITARDVWEYEAEVAAQEEIARMSNPEVEPVEKENDPFDVFNDYFDEFVEMTE